MVEAKEQYEWLELSLKDVDLGTDKEVSIPVTVRNIQSQKRSFRVF
ncbi:MAG: hypothetical protein M1431_08960 [Candidatus Thermoplasmatota archaeon]|nr:hypothetical protein [Candidatus Thermoplasmatota archaeon]